MAWIGIPIIFFKPPDPRSLPAGRERVALERTSCLVETTNRVRERLFMELRVLELQKSFEKNQKSPGKFKGEPFRCLKVFWRKPA